MQDPESSKPGSLSRKRRVLKCIVDQKSPTVHQVAAQFGMIGDGHMACGFLALSTLLDKTLSEKSIMHRLETEILPWILARREKYIETHPNEFVPDGTSWKVSAGRMNRASYLYTMASAVEIANYIHEAKCPTDVNVAFLRNVWEGPAVKDASIRCPRGEFTSAEDAYYLEEEKPFHGQDSYVQVAGRNLLTVEEFVHRVRETRGEWRIVIDSCGHFLIVRVLCPAGDEETLFEELDSLRRDKDTPSIPCVEFLINCMAEGLDEPLHK